MNYIIIYVTVFFFSLEWPLIMITLMMYCVLIIILRSSVILHILHILYAQERENRKQSYY